MKKEQLYIKIIILLGLMVSVTVGCERLSDEVAFATSKTAEVLLMVLAEV
jgi:hypothetical protein